LGDTTHRRFPTRLHAFAVGQISEVQAGYTDRMTAVRSDRNGAYWWGRGFPANRTSPIFQSGSQVQSVSSGIVICVARGSYTYCMGSHNQGMTGRGLSSGSDNTLSYFTSERVKASANAYRAGMIDIKSGGLYTCGRTAAGSVYCWGSNTSGALGRGTSGSFSAYAAPVKMASRGYPSLGSVNEMGLGREHVCVSRTTSGTLYCWGEGEYGQLGIGATSDRTRATLVSVPGIRAGEGFRSLGAGSVHTCGVTELGRVFCWGSNSQGQIGIGQGVSTALRPQQVLGLRGRSVAVGVGAFHTCVLNSDYDIFCWGHNEYGQLGDGSPVGNGAKVYRPSRVLDLP